MSSGSSAASTTEQTAHAGPDDNRLTPATADRKLVAAVVSVVQLVEVRMVWSSADIRVLPNTVPWNWSESADYALDAGCTDATTQGFDAETFSMVSWSQAAGATPSDGGDEPDKSDVEIIASYRLSYEFQEEVEFEHEALQHFCAFNATFNAWPYFREFAQSTAQRMNLGQIVVPVLKIPNITGRG